MSTLRNSRAAGFSLIELMVGIIILAILAGIAMPNFKIWLQNSQIRNATESILSGLQRARATAVSRNASVEFTLGSGTSWAVNEVGGASNPVDSRSSTEGSKDVVATVTPAGANTVTFNNFGSVASNADASATLSQVQLDSSILAPADSRELRVTIGTGGNVRMCDPNAPGTSLTAC